MSFMMVWEMWDEKTGLRKSCHVPYPNQLPISLTLCPGLMVFRLGLSRRMSSIWILKRAAILLKVSPLRAV
ncbi:Uncharacterised protein [Neisseria gonorrhoeae]|uniref:Uncharacterized protein n=1 Tax=Neisseria gonorrhoeae TaxID=485 RepID=A0A378VY15_NEIGO|nr:Uncharacterised protein [Neisseria gonorrhoeae]